MVLKILNSKQIKNLNILVQSQWGCDLDKQYVFLENEKGRIFIVNHDFSKLEIDDLRIQNVGIYFGEMRNNELRLSIEGSQLLGPKASKNVLELNKEESDQWMLGYDLDKKSEINHFVLIKSRNDFLGCGKLMKEKLLNFVPKERRIRDAH